jgi:hypothetical protein
MAKKQPTENALEGWNDIIKEMGAQGAKRRKERKAKLAQRLKGEDELLFDEHVLLLFDCYYEGLMDGSTEFCERVLKLCYKQRGIDPEA